MQSVEQFYLNQEEPEQSAMLALRRIVLDFDPKINERLRYGMPSYFLEGKMVCYIWKDKKTKTPYLLVSAQLDFPELFQGDRKRMKVLYCPADRDLPIDFIRKMLSEIVKSI